MAQDGRSGTGGARAVFTRALVVVVTVALMAASAAGGYAAATRFEFMPRGGSQQARQARSVIDTPVLSLELPDTPVVAQDTSVDGGVAVAVTSWVVNRPDMAILVTASDYSELMLQQELVSASMFDALIASLAVRSGAAVEESTDVIVGADNARHVTLRTADRSAFSYMVLHGSTLLNITVETRGELQPPEYDSIVASVAWKA